MLGLSTIVTTLDTYKHVMQNLQREAASKMEDVFLLGGA
jgi:hypothetical protein